MNDNDRSASGQRSDKETKQVMDDALKRALRTPPTPHKPTKKDGDSKAAAKPRRKAGRGA